MENTTICHTISEMALRVSKEVGIAGYTGLGIHEETLSDFIETEFDMSMPIIS